MPPTTLSTKTLPELGLGGQRESGFESGAYRHESRLGALLDACGRELARQVRRLRTNLSAMLSEECCEACRKIVAIERLTFPNYEHVPAGGAQLPSHAPVPLDVVGELLSPICRPRLRSRCSNAASVSMPEASMDEDRFPRSGEDKVGCSRQIAAMKSKPIAQSMGDAADDDLRSGILPSHSGHERRTSLIYRLARKKPSRCGVSMRRSRLLSH